MIQVLTMPPVPPKFTKRDDRPALQGAKYRVRCTLQNYLDAQELTRQEFSKQTGLSAAAIRGLSDNTSKRFDADTIAAVCQFFGIAVGDLLILEEKERRK
jgi:DNA-binding Xre family transcriptional regulator